MDNRRIACFDAYYYNNYAKACCVVFDIIPSEKVISRYCEIVDPIKNYISGEFYKRELPCILGIHSKLAADIDIIIVDSYVFLENGKKGLGAHLFEALNNTIPIIGVAKNPFKGCTDYVQIYRGQSRNPLYISSVGIELGYAARLIKNLSGNNRIPDRLREVDQLTRSNTET